MGVPTWQMAVPPQRRCTNVAFRAAMLCLQLLIAPTLSELSSASSETQTDDETDQSSSGIDVNGLEQSLNQGGVDGMLMALSAMKMANSNTGPAIPIVHDKEGHEMYDFTTLGKSPTEKSTTLEDKSHASQQAMAAPLPIAVPSPPASISLGTLVTPSPVAIAKVPPAGKMKEPRTTADFKAKAVGQSKAKSDLDIAVSGSASAQAAQPLSPLHPRPVFAQVADTNVRVRGLRGGQQLSSHAASEQPVTARSTSTTSDAEADRLRSGLLDMRSTIDSLIGGTPGASHATVLEKSTKDLTNKLSQQYRDMGTRVAALEETESKLSQQNQDVAGRLTKLEKDSGKRNKPVYTQTKAAANADKARYQELTLRLSALQKENQELKEEQSSQSDQIKGLEANETKDLDLFKQWQKENTDGLQAFLKSGMEDLHRARDENDRLKAKLDKVISKNSSFLAMKTSHRHIRARKKRHAIKRDRKTFLRRKHKGRSRR